MSQLNCTASCSITHPRESAEWIGMSMEQRFEFFAPVWRVMRDNNMDVAEVCRQIQHVALAVKKGTEVWHGDLKGKEPCLGWQSVQSVLHT
jgi:hypothetical protein